MTKSNRYAIFLPAIIMAAMAFFNVGCQSTYEYKGVPLEPPLAVPDFELTATDGRPFHLSDVEGDFALIYFGYTFCPDVCPLTMANVSQALTGLEGRENVHVIFITVDPERDTPEQLERYVKAFGSDFIALTDDFGKTQAVMKAYGAFAEKEEVPDSAAGYLVSHTARLYLVGPKREVLLTYPFGFTPEDLRSDLTYLLQQQES